MQEERTKFITIIIVLLAAAYIVAPMAKKWPPFVQNAEIKLGIDLAGGAELTYRVLYPAGYKGSKEATTQEALAVLQRRIQATGREVEQRVEGLLSGVESEVSRRTDSLLHGWSQTLRREQDRLRDRFRVLESRIGEIAKQGSSEALEELRAGLTWARSSIEQLVVGARQIANNVDDAQRRMQQLERRMAEVARESARDIIDGDEFRHKLNRLEQWVSDIARDVGSRNGEQGALRERLTRLEGRFVTATKEEAARAASGATLKDRQARTEARVADLTKELLARSIDSSTIKERLAHAESLLVALNRTGKPGIQEEAESITNP